MPEILPKHYGGEFDKMLSEVIPNHLMPTIFETAVSEGGEKSEEFSSITSESLDTDSEEEERRERERERLELQQARESMEKDLHLMRCTDKAVKSPPEANIKLSD